MKHHTDRLGFLVAMCLIFTVGAWAQYPTGGGTGGTGTGGTYTAPAGGYKTSTGVIVGVAAAAGGAAAFLLLHNRGTVKGCVENGSSGTTLTSGKTVYTLVGAPSDVKPGERFELKGKTLKDKAGHRSFDVQKVGKDLGPC